MGIILTSWDQSGWLCLGQSCLTQLTALLSNKTTFHVVSPPSSDAQQPTRGKLTLSAELLCLAWLALAPPGALLSDSCSCEVEVGVAWLHPATCH